MRYKEIKSPFLFHAYICSYIFKNCIYINIDVTIDYS